MITMTLAAPTLGSSSLQFTRECDSPEAVRQCQHIVADTLSRDDGVVGA
jgi:hypothetical protein